MEYFLISLLLIGWLPFVVEPEAAGNAKQDSGKFASASAAQEEEQFLLDSTRIGIRTVASGLTVPWEMVWGPDNWIWFTEQSGLVSRLNPATGEKKTLLKFDDVYTFKLGLLSMALHPDMKKSPFVFLNYIYRKDSVSRSKLVRYTYNGTVLSDPKTIFEIPANTGHNGSRLLTGTDGKIIWSTGDASCCGTGDFTKRRYSQDTALLHGKILRLNIDGSIPSDNPFPGSAVWSLGFRVPQGLVYGADNYLYSAEHGDAVDDEVNLVEKGRNYGYPVVTGICDLESEKAYCTSHNIAEPLKAWTPTIAPAGIDYYASDAIPEWKNSILLVALKDQSFRTLQLNQSGKNITSEKIYFEKKFGRLRDICVSPSGDVFISTSNRDWNKPEGFPLPQDDRIIRLSKTGTSSGKVITRTAAPAKTAAAAAGQALYVSYCGSCHKENGAGVAGVFPPLNYNPFVSGDKNRLIRTVLYGMSGPVKVKGVTYNQAMPAFGFLKDQEIADLLAYIRDGLGNRSGKVTAAEVAAVRNQNK